MNLSFKKSILYFIVSVTIANAQAPGDDQVWAGVNAFYNYETGKAITILSRARLDYPENPTVHLTWAAARWLHSQANDPVPVTYRILERDLEEIIPIYKILVAKYPDNPAYKLYLGSAIGLKARVHLGKKEWLKTLLTAYKGFSIIQKVARDNPDLVDAQLPIGIVEYYAGLSNLLVKWAVELWGLETTREAGLKKIEWTADHGKFAWIEAKSICSFLYLWVDPNPVKALKHSSVLAGRFPNNFYFNVMYVESLIKNGANEKAENQLRAMEISLKRLTPIQQRWYLGYLRYEWALYYFNQKDYAQALRSVNEAIKVYDAELDVILANAWLLKGKLHDVMQERKKAKYAYKHSVDLSNYTYAIKEAKQYRKTPFVPGN